MQRFGATGSAGWRSRSKALSMRAVVFRVAHSGSAMACSRAAISSRSVLISSWVRGRATKTGMLVGAVTGAIATGIFVGLVVAAVCEVDCDNAGLEGGLVGFGIGAVGGALVGAAIGAAIPKWRLRFP